MVVTPQVIHPPPLPHICLIFSSSENLGKRAYDAGVSGGVCYLQQKLRGCLCDERALEP